MTTTPTLERPTRRQAHIVHNTCAKSSLHKRLTRQLTGIMAHLENNPNDDLSRKRVATINDLLREAA